jgi:hypothetical protein
MDVNVRDPPPNPLPSLPWDASAARLVLGELKRSGLSMAKFASMHGFAPHRLYFWSRKLATKPAGATLSSSLLSVNVVSSPPEVARAVGSGFVELRSASRCTVRVHGSVDLEQLSLILKICGVMP